MNNQQMNSQQMTAFQNGQQGNQQQGPFQNGQPMQQQPQQNGAMMPQQQRPMNMHAAQPMQQQQVPPTPAGWGGNPTGETPTLKFKDLPVGVQILGCLKRVDFTDNTYMNKYAGRQVVISVQIESGPQEMIGKLYVAYLGGSKYTDFLSLGINTGDGWGFNNFGQVTTKNNNTMQKIGQLCEKRTQNPPAQDPKYGQTEEEYYAARMGFPQQQTPVQPQNVQVQQAQPPVQQTPQMPMPGQANNMPVQQPNAPIHSNGVGVPQTQTQTNPQPEIPNFFPQQNGGQQ